LAIYEEHISFVRSAFYMEGVAEHEV